MNNIEMQVADALFSQQHNLPGLDTALALVASNSKFNLPDHRITSCFRSVGGLVSIQSLKKVHSQQCGASCWRRAPLWSSSLCWNERLLVSGNLTAPQVVHTVSPPGAQSHLILLSQDFSAWIVTWSPPPHHPRPWWSADICRNYLTGSIIEGVLTSITPAADQNILVCLWGDDTHWYQAHVTELNCSQAEFDLKD